MAAVSAQPNGPSTGPSRGPAAPRAFRVARWVPLVAVLPLAFVAVLIPLSQQTGSARPVPPDMCALVPPDLLSRLVPSARRALGVVDSSHNQLHLTNCRAETDLDVATTTATARLTLQFDRYGPRGSLSPAENARDAFARDKQVVLAATGTRHKVSDLVGLGDSAYLDVLPPTVVDSAEGGSFATVSVLRGDGELTITYGAAPSTDELTAAAAVSVAREVAGRLP
jgi:hypothetical protein